MKKHALALAIIMIFTLLSFGCNVDFENFGVGSISKEDRYDEMETLISRTEDYKYVSINPHISGILKGKTHKISSTVTIRCSDKGTFDKVEQNKDVLMSEITKIYKKIEYTEILDMESYEKIEMKIKKRIDDKLFVDDSNLIVELSDIIFTELK